MRYTRFIATSAPSVLAFLTLLLVGCGGKYSVAPVSGTLTLNGKPLEDATVTFTPSAMEGGEVPASSGRTDANGKYTLSIVSDNSSGAVIGKHTVRISKNVTSESDIMTAAERKQAALPPQDFSFEVKSGPNTADFKLGK